MERYEERQKKIEKEERRRRTESAGYHFEQDTSSL
jgi:hypothetical protein